MHKNNGDEAFLKPTLNFYQSKKKKSTYGKYGLTTTFMLASVSRGYEQLKLRLFGIEKELLKE